MQRRTLSLLTGGFCLLSATAQATFLPAPLGEQTRYQLSYQADATVDTNGLLGRTESGNRTQRTHLRAQLETVQIAASVLAVRLHQPEITTLANGQPQERAGQKEGLLTWSFLNLDSAGRVQSIAFPSGVTLPARMLTRTLVSGLQFVRPTGVGSEWRVQQPTVNGTANVAYRTLSATRYEKRVLGYPIRREIGLKGERGMRVTGQGTLLFTLAQKRVERAEGFTTTLSKMGERQIAVVRERFQLQRLGQAMASDRLCQQLTRDYQVVRVAEAPTALNSRDRNPQAERASWESVLGDANFPTLLRQLEAAKKEEKKDYAALFSQLQALLHLQSEAATQLGAWLKTAPPDSVGLQVAASALNAVLSSAESELPMARAAQQALYTALEAQQKASAAVLSLAPALGDALAPQPESWQLLEKVSLSQEEDSAIAATLALGSLTRHCPSTIRKALLDRLVARLTAAPAMMQEPLISALGNAGAVETLDALAAYTRHTDPSVRGTAYMSLRFIVSSQVMPLLHQGLRDKEESVRLQAARGMLFRPFTAQDVSLVAQAIPRETSEQTRLTLLENLAREQEFHPQARLLLKAAQKRERSAEIRTAIAGWLQ